MRFLRRNTTVWIVTTASLSLMDANQSVDTWNLVCQIQQWLPTLDRWEVWQWHLQHVTWRFWKENLTVSIIPDFRCHEFQNSLVFGLYRWVKLVVWKSTITCPLYTRAFLSLCESYQRIMLVTFFQGHNMIWTCNLCSFNYGHFPTMLQVLDKLSRHPHSCIPVFVLYIL